MNRNLFLPLHLLDSPLNRDYPIRFSHPYLNLPMSINHLYPELSWINRLDDRIWANYFLILQHFHSDLNSTYLACIYQERAISKLQDIGELNWKG